MLELKIKDENEILELYRRRYLENKIDDTIAKIMKSFDLSKNDINDIVKFVYTSKDGKYTSEIYITNRYDTEIFNNENLELILEKLNSLYDFMFDNIEVIYGKQ